MFKRNEYGILNRMLDDAISGSFEESRFDESELSKLQSKLMRYLSSASMSERKLQEEKSRIEELITNISHQTKTPLTNIMMYSELLCETTKDEMASKYAEEIHVQSKKLDELIKALVKMSRLETGIFQLQREATSLMKVARNAAAQVVPAAKEKDIRLIIDETRDTEVLLDLKWTTEAICNILDNAVKYSEEGTEITISVFSYEMFSGIRITDRGIGIPEEDRERIFERFYRVDKSHSKAVGGTGLGLSIVKHGAIIHHAHIHVHSTLGQGTEIILEFPKKQDESRFDASPADEK